ncbi:aminotransferase class III-fold pyridoxal phosphate-dependent enzyme [Rubrivivax sp. JA1029]|uniref:aminotransferase class III-fold pyridoxal phosphate-dependent enzyme n=1 Tax=Rubrivivax sp. JA1029 TaxID=2894193 RepID=UPI001E343E1F|nr:aminotransferase class III-fold pyridoxal phosphate-dependent enzyme [Rubrivivax sp. JA1029]MCC9648003.1 aminotransferase class III-fold pyridoxal phosphate-dependent enzyme [Rubrivivax sp. JA1029]
MICEPDDRAHGILPLYGQPERVLARARGCRLVDAQGRPYVDFESGVWAANLGHAHPAVNRAIRRSLNAVMHQGYAFRSAEAETLAAHLARLHGLPGGRSVFLSSGSEAVNLGLQIAMHLSGRRRFVRLDGSYLAAFGFGRLAADNERRIDLRCDDLAAIDAVPWHEAAALVLEVGGASLEVVRFPREDFVARAVEAARRAGACIVCNEVTPGFGRTGRWFGYQHYGLVPQLVACGKALGNGYPVSALTVDAAVAAALDAQPLRYAQSHQNDPGGCAAALAVIEALEAGDWVARGAAVGEHFAARLAALQQRRPQQVLDVRGRGLMLALQLADEALAQRVARRLFERGQVVGQRGASLRFMPPLTVTKAMVDTLVREIGRALAAEPGAPR